MGGGEREELPTGWYRHEARLAYGPSSSVRMLLSSAFASQSVLKMWRYLADGRSTPLKGRRVRRMYCHDIGVQEFVQSPVEHIFFPEPHAIKQRSFASPYVPHP